MSLQESDKMSTMYVFICFHVNKTPKTLQLTPLYSRPATLSSLDVETLYTSTPVNKQVHTCYTAIIQLLKTNYDFYNVFPLGLSLDVLSWAGFHNQGFFFSINPNTCNC